MSNITNVGNTGELASQILKIYDKDGDGSLSGNEFGAFLTNLVSNIQGTARPMATAKSAAATLYPTALPASTTEPRVRTGTMLGFDEGKLGNSSHQTFKYQVGRILQYYPSTPAGLQQALPEIQKLVPDAKLVGTHGDKIDFGAYTDPKSGKIGVIDVLVGAASGGRGWSWQPVE